jgi:iron complex outermembrane receptor protein
MRITRPFRCAKAWCDDIDVFGLTVNANVNFADLTSATAYWSGSACRPRMPPNPSIIPMRRRRAVRAVPYTERDPSHQFSQEIRLTSHDSGGWHWVAGAFYSELHSVWNEIGESPARTRHRRFPTARTSSPGTHTR